MKSKYSKREKWSKPFTKKPSKLYTIREARLLQQNNSILRLNPIAKMSLRYLMSITKRIL